ncbi:putative flavohemoglobin [Fusarium austroafricanum]|uniref:nitric oxide dioxygenase n=1 Tax=Fusarium austroafricanum TaxID=2364996 RepID=A0A8H4KAL5_9HYPO|nr:putative flavohemoglobin [Fusarium austroafricanum]
MPLTASQVDIVKSTAPILKVHGQTITSLFYKNLIETYPDLRNIFNLSHQQDGAQSKALAGAVLAYASHIDNAGVLMPTIERIAQKHVSLKVTEDQYALVGEQLIKAIGLVLGDALTADIAEAWTAAYGQLANIFIDREKQLYEEAGEWDGWRKFKISKREKEADFITSFYLVPSDGKTPLPQFNPGQYVSLRIAVPELNGIFQCRQYSMSQAPHGDYYRVSIKKESFTLEGKDEPLPGTVSNLLHDLYQVGDEIEMTYPRGEFWLDIEDGSKAEAPLVLISAGVGVTPLMSMLESVLSSPRSKMTKRPVLWLHAARSSPQMAFGDYLRSVSDKHENVETTIFLKNVGEKDKKGENYDIEGRLDLDVVHATKKEVFENKNAQFFICGPASWMVATRDKLQSIGVAEEQINLELFGTGSVNQE